MESTETLLLLPGLDGTDVFFRPLMAALPPTIRARTVCYPDGGANSYEELLGPVRAAAAETGPCWVLGSSFSGPLAVMLAAAHPEHVRGLILAATFLRAPVERVALWRLLAVAPVVWLLRAARRVPVWTLRGRGDPLRVAKAETWRRVGARTLAARSRAALGADVRSVYNACPQRVLCIAFAADKVVPFSRAAEIVAGRPAAKLVVLPGGHLAMHTDPEPFRDAVAGFMANNGEIVTPTGLDSSQSSP
jgi:pimeloyl-ACP methyl ester carboxylesterase